MTTAALLAFVRADVVARFRRTSTLVLLGVMLAASWAWVPDPSTGRALIVIGEQRALYTAGAIGLATASVATLFIGLFGFYAVSNGVARDVRTRVGQMIASTPLPSIGYLAGRFVGNFAYLSALLGVYAAGSFLMVFVRGEGSFAPVNFLLQYVLLCGPALVAVSAFALFFEVTPLLRTRLGDVGFFILWMVLLGGTAASESREGVQRWFDLSGLGWMIAEMKAELGTSSVGIGATTFDTSLPPVPFEGIPFSARTVAERYVSVVLPLALLPVSVLVFHRFDPAKVRSAESRSRRGMSPFSSLSRLFHWIPLPQPRGLISAAVWDARLTLMERPLSFMAVMIAWVSAASGGKASIAVGFAAAGLLIADVASREKGRGTSALIDCSPLVGSRIGAWKLVSSLIIVLAVMAPHLVLVAASDLVHAARILGGCVLATGLANTLGFLTGGARTYVAILLMGTYVAMSSGGVGSLDFAGFFPGSDPEAALAWSATAGVSVLTAIAAPTMSRER